MRILLYVLAGVCLVVLAAFGGLRAAHAALEGDRVAWQEVQAEVDSVVSPLSGVNAHGPIGPCEDDSDGPAGEYFTMPYEVDGVILWEAFNAALQELGWALVEPDPSEKSSDDVELTKEFQGRRARAFFSAEGDVKLDGRSTFSVELENKAWCDVA